MRYLHSHIKRLQAVSLYRAPYGDSIKPQHIPPGVEYVEIITAGVVIYHGEHYRRGTMFWHHAGDKTVHRYPPHLPYSCFVFKFQVAVNSQPEVPAISQWGDVALMDEFCTDILYCFHNDAYSRDTVGPCVYATLFWQAYRSTLRQATSKMPSKVIRAMKFIKQHLTAAVGVSDIARAAGVSEPHLYLLFRQHLQATPHQYLLGQRLQQARQMLVSSTASVKEICFACGFCNSETFHRAFKKRYHQTPLEYRNYHLPGG